MDVENGGVKFTETSEKGGKLMDLRGVLSVDHDDVREFLRFVGEIVFHNVKGTSGITDLRGERRPYETEGAKSEAVGKGCSGRR